MRAGTHIRFPDGRTGTVVYNGLDGVGIKWGIHIVTLDDVACSGAFGPPPAGYRWFPDAMLRQPYPGANLPCVNEEYTIIDADQE